MVLEDPVIALGAAAFVFFILLGVLYLWDPEITANAWFGILFVLVAVMILLFLLQEPGLAGLAIGAIAAFVGRRVLSNAGIGE